MAAAGRHAGERTARVGGAARELPLMQFPGAGRRSARPVAGQVRSRRSRDIQSVSCGSGKKRRPEPCGALSAQASRHRPEARRHAHSWQAKNTPPRSDGSPSARPECVRGSLGSAPYPAQRPGVGGRDVARGDGVDVDAPGSPFAGEEPRQAEESQPTRRRAIPGRGRQFRPAQAAAVQVWIGYGIGDAAPRASCGTRAIAASAREREFVPDAFSTYAGGIDVSRDELESLTVEELMRDRSFRPKRRHWAAA